MVPSPLPGISPIMATLSPQTSQNNFHNRQQQQQQQNQQQQQQNQQQQQHHRQQIQHHQNSLQQLQLQQSQFKIIPSTSQRHSGMNIINGLSQQTTTTTSTTTLSPQNGMTRNEQSEQLQQQQQQRTLINNNETITTTTTTQITKAINNNQQNELNRLELPTSSTKSPITTLPTSSNLFNFSSINKFETMKSSFTNMFSNNNSNNNRNNNNNNLKNNLNENYSKISSTCDKNNSNENNKSDQDIKRKINNNHNNNNNNNNQNNNINYNINNRNNNNNNNSSDIISIKNEKVNYDKIENLKAQKTEINEVTTTKTTKTPTIISNETLSISDSSEINNSNVDSCNKSVVTNFKTKQNNEKRRKSVNQDNQTKNSFLDKKKTNINTQTQRFDGSKKREILLKNLNPHIICNLCKGYLIDATTIVECLHSFCHSCIMKHLMTEQYCPQCEMMINTAKPNIKPDTTLQAIVYKLVPGLYEKELMRKRAFYRDRPKEAALVTPEQRGEDTENLIFSPTEFMSLSLEYADVEQITLNQDTYGLTTPKYLQCPAILTVSHLKKFVIIKFDIDTTRFNVEIMYKVKTIVLYDHYTLMDVAYIYTWKRDAPMRFFFRVKESGKSFRRARRKSIKSEAESLKSSNTEKCTSSLINSTTNNVSNDNNVNNNINNCSNNKKEIKIKQEKEEIIVETENNQKNTENVPDSCFKLHIKREKNDFNVNDNKITSSTHSKSNEINYKCSKTEYNPSTQNGLKHKTQSNQQNNFNISTQSFNQKKLSNIGFNLSLGSLDKENDKSIEDSNSVYDFKSDSPLSSPNSSFSTSSNQQKTEKLKITLCGKNKTLKVTSSKPHSTSNEISPKSNHHHKTNKHSKSEQNSSQQSPSADESRKPENIKMKIDISKQDSIKIINMSGPDSIPKEIVKMVKPEKEWKIKVKSEREEKRSSPSPKNLSSEGKAKSMSPQTVPPITIKAKKPSPKTPKISPDISNGENQKKSRDLNEDEKKSEFLNAFALTPIKNISPHKSETPNSNYISSSRLSKDVFFKTSKSFAASVNKFSEKKRKSKDLMRNSSKRHKFEALELSILEKKEKLLNKETKNNSNETISFKLCPFPIGSGSENKNASSVNSSKDAEDVYKFENTTSPPKPDISELRAMNNSPKHNKSERNILPEQNDTVKVPNTLEKESKKPLEKTDIKAEKVATQNLQTATPEFKVPQKHNIVNKSISDSVKRTSYKKIMPAPPPLKTLDSHKKSSEQPTPVSKLPNPNVVQNPLANYHRIASPGSTTPHPNRPMLVPSGIASSQQQFIAAPGSRTPIAKRYANILPKQTRPNPFANIPSEVNKMLKNSGTEIKPLTGPENPSVKVYGPAMNINGQNNSQQNMKFNPPVQMMQNHQIKNTNSSKNNNSFLNFALMNATRSKSIDVSVGYRTPIYTPNYASSSPIYSPNSPQYVPNYNIPVQPTYKYTPKTNNNSGSASYLQSVLGTNNQFSSLFPAPPVKQNEDLIPKFANPVHQPPENNDAKKQSLSIVNKITSAVTENKDEEPIEKRIKVKSLLNSCNINIPSSLSITITNDEADNKSNNYSNNSKHKNPVNNYIEILKLPDQPTQEQGSNDNVASITSSATPTKTSDATVNSANNSPKMNNSLTSSSSPNSMFSNNQLNSEKISNQKISPNYKEKNSNKNLISQSNSLKTPSPDKKLGLNHGNSIGEKRKSTEKFSPEKDAKLLKLNDTTSNPSATKKFRHILPRAPQTLQTGNIKSQLSPQNQKSKDKTLIPAIPLNSNFPKSTLKSLTETSPQGSQPLKSTNFNIRTNFPNSPTGSINLNQNVIPTHTSPKLNTIESKSETLNLKSTDFQPIQPNSLIEQKPPQVQQQIQHQLQQLPTNLNIGSNIPNAANNTVDVANFLQQALIQNYTAAQIQNYAAAAAAAVVNNDTTAAAIQAQQTPNGIFISPHTYTAFSNGYGQYTTHPNYGYTQAIQQALMLEHIARMEKAQLDQNKSQQQLQQHQQVQKDQQEQMKKQQELQQQHQQQLHNKQQQQQNQKTEEIKKEKILQSPQQTFEKQLQKQQQQQQQQQQQNQQQHNIKVNQKEESDKIKSLNINKTTNVITTAATGTTITTTTSASGTVTTTTAGLNVPTTGITALQKLINNVQNGASSAALGLNNTNNNSNNNSNNINTNNNKNSNSTVANNKKETKEKDSKNINNKIRKQQQQQSKTENNSKIVPSLSPTTQMNNTSSSGNSIKK